MWKFERAWPFYLMVIVWILRYFSPMVLAYFGFLSTSSSMENLESFTAFNRWLFSTVCFFTSIFYLRRKRFEGDQFTALLILIGLYLFSGKVMLFLPESMMHSFFYLIIFLYIPAIIFAFFYRKRYLSKVQKGWGDRPKLILALIFVVLNPLFHFLSLIGTSFFSTDDFSIFAVILDSSPLIIVIIFFLVHLKSLQLKEDGAAHYEKLIDDFGGNAKG